MIQFYDHGLGRFTPEGPIRPSYWDRFDLLCVHEGQLRLTFEQRETVDLSAGWGTLIYPLTRFEGTPTTGSCQASVQHFGFDAEMSVGQLPVPFQSLVGQKHGYELRRIPQGNLRVDDFKRAVHFAFDHPSEQLHDLRVAQLTLILGQMVRTESTSMLAGAGEQWQTLVDWLRKRLGEPLTVPDMAAYCGLSTSHFRVRFRRTFDMSPGRYLQRLRLQEAQRLMRESDLPIKTIARRTGYDDLPNFYRAFRQHLGYTPAQYRQRYTLKG